MLPLSKLPVTQERRLKGFVLGDSTNTIDASIESASQLDGSMNTHAHEAVTGDPKQKLKHILEGKPEISSLVERSRNASDPMISVVQVVLILS